MVKNLARRNLICFAVLAAILIALCFVDFMIPTTNTRFVGFVNAITKDMDIEGGYSGKYIVTFGDSVLDKKQEFADTVDLINNKLVAYGYESANVGVNEDNEMYIEMPKIKNASSILSSALIKEGTLCITTASDVSSFDSSKDIGPKDVITAYSMFGQTSAVTYSWGVNIELTSEGQTKLSTMTADASGSTYLYIYVGENQITKIGPISSQIDQSYLFFHGTGNSEDDTNLTAFNILLGTHDVGIELENGKITQIAPLIGDNAKLLIWIALGVIVAAIIAIMFILFGELGYIFTLLLAFFVTLIAFFMQALPIYSLSFSGIIGLAIGLIMFFISNAVIYNTAKKGCAEGKKIPLAIKLGISKSIMKIVDVSVVLIIGSVFMYIFGGAFIKSFALTLALCSALNMFVSILMNKLFTKWYVAINSKNYKKLHFVKGEPNDASNN